MRERFLFSKYLGIIFFVLILLMVLHYYSSIHLTWFAPLFFEKLPSRREFDGNFRDFQENKPNLWMTRWTHSAEICQLKLCGVWKCTKHAA